MAAAVTGGAPDAVRGLARDFAAMLRGHAGETASAALDGLKPLSGVAAYPSRIKCDTLPWAAMVAALDGAREASSE